MGFHYRFNASGAHRWLKCLAYKMLQSQVPERPTGDAARIGTAAHYLAEWALTHGYGSQVDEKMIGLCVRINPDGDAFQIVSGPGVTGYSGIQWANPPKATAPDYPHVIEVDEDMVRGVSIYTNLVTALIAKYPGSALHVEQSFELQKDMGGSADCVIVASDRIIVIDYKNGRGYVDPKDNPQLAMYGVGALENFNPHNTIKEVILCVVQPNAGKGPAIKTWKVTPIELVEWAVIFEGTRNEILGVEQEYRKKGFGLEPVCLTGPHCKWCEASHICPAMHNQTKALAQNHIPAVNPNAVPMPHTIPEEKLLWIAERGDAIIDFVGQCRAYMFNEALKGKQWPGHKLVEKQTRRKLVNTDELTKQLKHEDKMDGFDIKLKALSKLEKLYGKDYLAPFVEKPKGDLELVPFGDPRKEMNQTIVASLPDVKG